MDRRVIRAWCLYDFGNSSFAALFITIYAIYFKDGVGGGDTGWSWIVSTSMLAVAVTSPFLGGVADHAGVRKRLLAAYTATGIAAVLGFSFLAPGAVAAGIVLGIVANVAFEGGIVFYNAYLPDIAPPERHGRVSAWGFGVGYAGSLVALGAATACVHFGFLDGVWLVIALQWGLFSLPAFRLLPPDRGGLGFLEAAMRGFRGTAATLRDVLSMRDLRRFLLAYFFYMDGVLTVIAFSAIYATGTLAFTQGQVIGLFAAVQLAALGGSFAMGPPTDRKGPGFTVRLTLLWWIGVVAAAAAAKDKTVFAVVAVLAGLGLGAVQAASRAFLARLVPEGREAELFGFYALCGKTGSILGPALFGVLSAFFHQRVAVLAVAGFFALGLLLLRGLNPAARCSSTAR